MNPSNDNNLESASTANAPENSNSTDSVGHKARPTAESTAVPCGSGFTPDNPTYTFTPRVLDRWSRQNLQYSPNEEQGGGQAQFRFHGSTCGNIEFDLLYHVTVGSSEDGWPIIAQHCEPAPHGDGHTRMCCWRESSAMVEDWMTREAPLLNQPLANTLTWAPAKSASGCLCHVDGRMHKWNAVLQTLHFALSKNTNPS